MDITSLWSALNWLDIGILVMFAFFIGRGLWAGFSVAVSTLFGVVLGFYVAAQQFPFVSVKLSPFIHNELWRSLISFALLFLVVYLAFLVAGILLRGFFRVIKLSWLDRLLGGVVGLAKGLIFAGIMIFILTLVLPEGSPLLKSSLLYPRLSRVAQALNNLAPANIKGKFMWKWRKLEKELKKKGNKEIGKALSV